MSIIRAAVKLGPKVLPGIRVGGKSVANAAKRPGRTIATGVGVGGAGAVAGAGLGYGVKKIGTGVAGGVEATIRAATDPVAALPGETVDKTLSPLDPTGQNNAGIGLAVAAAVGIGLVVVIASTGGSRRRR